jgi:ornithine carbamoyltransferase
LNRLLRIGDLSAVELKDALALAAGLRDEPLAHAHAFEGRSLACFIDDPATRQHLAVATAARRLGLLPVMLTRREVDGLRADPTGDIPRTLAAYAAGFVVGTLNQRELRELAASVSVPVISAGSDEEDPVGALGDLLTLLTRCGTLEGLVIAYVGAADAPAAHSLMEAAARMGMHLRIACPPEHLPIAEIATATAALAPAHGGSIEHFDDPREAVAGARAIYTTPWPEALDGAFRVDTALLRRAGPDAWLMHPLPANRGQEVTAAAIEGPHSLVLEQAANRLPGGQAALLEVLR